MLLNTLKIASLYLKIASLNLPEDVRPELLYSNPGCAYDSYLKIPSAILAFNLIYCIFFNVLWNYIFFAFLYFYKAVNCLCALQINVSYKLLLTACMQFLLMAVSINTLLQSSFYTLQLFDTGVFVVRFYGMLLLSIYSRQRCMILNLLYLWQYSTPKELDWGLVIVVGKINI